MQINNLKIKFNKMYEKWQVINPDKRALEEFALKDNAIEYAKSIKDFVKRGK